MEEHQRGTLPRLPVGDGLSVDLYRMQLSTSHRFRPNDAIQPPAERSEVTRMRPQAVDVDFILADGRGQHWSSDFGSLRDPQRGATDTPGS
jgi:hypothetical protein